MNLVPRTGASAATERIRQKDAPHSSIRGGKEHGPSPRTGSSGGEPGATDWSVRGNGENASKRRPGLEHPGRTGARHKPPDWIVPGGTRGHGLEQPRQRRENGKKTPRIGASGADRGKAQTPGLDRPGVHPVPRTGTSGDATHPDWNVRGRGAAEATNKEKETAAERHGEENKNKSKERMGEDKKERRREAGGEREEGEAAKHMEPGCEQLGKQRNQSGSTRSGAAQEIVKRERPRLREERAAAAARTEEERMNKSQGRWRERTGKTRDGKGEEH